jgi:altronate hydrolase
MLVLAWWRLRGFDESLPFGLAAGTVAVAFLLATGTMRGARDTGGTAAALGFEAFAAATLAALAIGLVMVLDRGALTVALALSALGAAVDRLVRHGGTAILSETPEIYGGEHLLTRRAASPAVADKLLARIAWWERYTARSGMKMDNNPSAGNKAGGLTTILEKSLGAIAKSGTTNLVDVYGFAERVTARGFVYMDTPGYDPVSATGQVAGGANLICFTTGRGSAYGCAPTPSLKLSTNTALWLKQQDDIDLDCGGIVEGLETVDEAGERIFRLMLETASGRATRSEGHGYGQNEFVPWQLGAVM